MDRAAPAIDPDGGPERKTVSSGGFINKTVNILIIYFIINQISSLISTKSKLDGRDIYEEKSSNSDELVDLKVPHSSTKYHGISNPVELWKFDKISKLHSYMVPDVDHLSFKVSFKSEQCQRENLSSSRFLKSELSDNILSESSTGYVDDSVEQYEIIHEDTSKNVIDVNSSPSNVFPIMELREMGTDDPGEDEQKLKELENEERHMDESQTGTGFFNFAAREWKRVWDSVTGNDDRKAAIAREKEIVIKKIIKRQKQASEGPFSDIMQFSLNEAPRFVQKELDITDSFFNNCTVLAVITVTYSKQRPKWDNGKNVLFPPRQIHFSYPLISFVEKEERKLMNLFTEEDDADELLEQRNGTDIPKLALDLEQKTKKRSRKKNKVISRMRRKKSKVDEAVDTMMGWVKEQLFGFEPKDNENVTFPTNSENGQLSVIGVDGVSTIPFSMENNKGIDTKSGKVKTAMVAKFQPKLTLSPVVDATSYSVSDIPAPLKNVLSLVNSPTISQAEQDAIIAGNTQDMSVAEKASYGFYSPLIYLNNFWVLDDHLIELSEYCFRDDKTGEKSYSDEDEDIDNESEKSLTQRGAGAVTMDDDAIQINDKLEKLRNNPTQRLKVNFTLEVRSISLLKYMLFTQFDASMDMHEDFGTMTRKERDGTKKMFLDTHPVFLIVTMVVSILHMLFEYLAFKNEVKFWRSRKNFKGLSLRTVAVNCYFQTIIFLYLMDSEQTSYMILLPCGIGVLIEFWKLFKTVKIQRNSENGKLDFSFNKSYDSVTSGYDRIAMKWLGITLMPFLIGYTVYSALYDEHKGWYSFTVATQVRFIYFSGFVMMTPQIFINYKLKSVAHLPWRMFVYRFLNTIIDDLFAFIVTMPTMHRLACFRDDIVFFILLYQRWKYPVDTCRTEDGESIELLDKEEDIDKGGDIK